MFIKNMFINFFSIFNMYFKFVLIVYNITIFKLKYMHLSTIIFFLGPVFVSLISKVVCQQSDTVRKYHAKLTNGKLVFKEHCIGHAGYDNAGNDNGITLEVNKKRVLLYKDPTKMLGKPFNNTMTKSLCASHLTIMGSSLVSNHFTKQGIDMCTKVCKRQLERILKVYPTIIVLKDTYCSRSGIKMASCVCEFKVSCQVNIHSVLIHFIVNRDGYLAMFHEEVGKPYLF